MAMGRNQYDGEPFFCTTCSGQYTLPAGTCLIHEEFRTCLPESKDAAMDRRARWLLKEEFDPEQAKPWTNWEKYNP